jgi:hypothetical protein
VAGSDAAAAPLDPDDVADGPTDAASSRRRSGGEVVAG